MSKRQARQRSRQQAGGSASETAAASAATTAAGGSGNTLRETLLGALGQFAAAPLIGLFAGFPLLFGGIFLAIAWTIGPQPLIDSYRYASYTAHAEGRIVDSWAALDFDPTDVPGLRWHPYAKISTCVIVEYAGDWGTPQRRGFCGNRFTFSDSFRFDDQQTMAPGVPFAFLRDASGFSIGEMRLTRTAYDWLASHSPHDTFMLSKPPPRTALAALQEQFDRPLDVAVASWTAPFPAYPLAFDPKRPDEALPAGIVAERQHGFQPVGLFFVVLLAVPGLFVWRAGMGFLTGQSGSLLWVLTIAPLLALPWWGDVLPRLIRQANGDWAMLASGMLDDISRVTRFTAGTPEDALLAGGARIVWHAEQGLYADTFGRVRFAPPKAPAKSADAAVAALRAQVRDFVGTLDAAAQVALFERLRRQYENNARQVQTLFTTAAEDTLRDPSSSIAVHRAARNFLSFASGTTYYDDQLDALEGKSPK